MAVSKSIKRKNLYRRILRFPQAKGKIVASAELSVSSDYFTVDIRFQDKTALSFDLESCVRVFSELADWKSGTYKPIRRWKSVHSRAFKQ